MLLDRETQIKVDQFRKYALFISEKFGVNVQLDGSRAETDGKTIFIPNIAGMDAREVDFLYSIILHEVGHIRYTNFNVEFMNTIKSDAHFDIWNCVEDARIENLLMKDFDGAKDIFTSLYCDFMMDKRFMDRVFGASVSEQSLWFQVCCYAHSSILKIEDSFCFMKLLKTNTRKQLQNWVKINKIDDLIKNHSMKTNEDAKDLATKIYNLFFKNKKDDSSANNTGKLAKYIEKALSVDTEDLKKVAEKLQKQLDKIIDEHGNLQKELEKLHDKKETYRKSIRPELDKIRDEQKNLSDAIKTKKALKAKERKKKSAQDALDKKREASSDLESKKDEAIRTMREEQDRELEQDEERNQSKIDKARKIIDKLKAKQDKIHQAIQPLQKKVDNYNNELEKLEKENAKLPEQMQDSSHENLIKQFKDNISRKRELADKLENMERDVNDKEDEMNDKAREYHDTRSEAGKTISNGMKNIEDNLHKNGVPSKIMPKFSEDKNWPEANKEQEKFDKNASKESGDIVTNGAGFGLQDSRDILALIEKTQNDLKNIDLSKHFLDTHKSSRLDSFNEIQTEINYTDVVEMGENVVLVHRKHVPLTTQFDKITTENTADGIELETVKHKNAVMLSQIKNVFRMKLKVQKRDRFRGGKDEGSLDTRALYKLATKTADDYLEINDPKLINKVKASIVIDCSGSEDKDHIGEENLKTLTLLLSEGLKEVFVQHEVSTYDAKVCDEMRRINASDVYNRKNNALNTVILKKFEDKKNTGIQNLKIEASDNSDGESIRLAVTRLLKQQSRRKILFVVSDCKPFLSDSNTGMLDAHLIDTIKWAKSNKIDIYSFSFGIAQNGSMFYGQNHCNITKWQDVTDFLWKKLI